MAFNPAEASPIVVVGGGFGGLTAALALSQHHPRPPIVLIEPQDHFVFLPLLYELLSEEMQPWEVVSSYPELVSERGISLLKEQVLKINRIDQHLTTSSGIRINYSQLVLSTGSVPADFDIPGVKDHAMTFHRLEDIAPLRKLVKTLQREAKRNVERQPAVVIIGAGPTGVELACKLADLLKGIAELHLIEMADSILATSKAFNRQQALKALKARHVHLHLQTSVEEITADHVVCNKSQAQTINTPIDISQETSPCFKLIHAGVIWTAGTKPVTPIIEPPIELIQGRLLVDESLQVIDMGQVVALGDASTCPEHSWPRTAQVALQQGKAAAGTVMAMRRKTAAKPFEFKDLGEMLSLGIGEATLTGLGVTLSGHLAFKLRRIAYLARMPGFSKGLLSAGAWFIKP